MRPRRPPHSFLSPDQLPTECGEVTLLEYLVSRERWSFHCLRSMAVLDIFDTLEFPGYRTLSVLFLPLVRSISTFLVNW